MPKRPPPAFQPNLQDARGDHGDQMASLLELRYATCVNVLGRPMYRLERKIHLPSRGAPTAAGRRRKRSVARSATQGCRRVSAVETLEWLFWEAAEDKTIVADPRLGGTHYCGIAVDLTLTDASTGLGTWRCARSFDDFTAMIEPRVPRWSASRSDLKPGASARHHDRDRSRSIIGPEWWHYHLPGREAFVGSNGVGGHGVDRCRRINRRLDTSASWVTRDTRCRRGRW